ncbi:hypothetical protein C8R47DRAFT_1081959 [Mycena vitilis]|nr:hypothetical protein C8R47DRAFT_1081959 [Mycena vitilis]
MAGAPTKASLAAKREAQARYRARNKEELRRKCREDMARRRATRTPEETAEYRAIARAEGARYRAENQAMLAHRARLRRARISIAKLGYEEWSARYTKRHQKPVPPALAAEFGPPLSSSDSSPDAPTPTDGEHSSDPTSNTTPAPPTDREQTPEARRTKRLTTAQRAALRAAATSNPLSGPPRRGLVASLSCPGLFDVGLNYSDRNPGAADQVRRFLRERREVEERRRRHEECIHGATQSRSFEDKNPGINEATHRVTLVVGICSPLLRNLRGQPTAETRVFPRLAPREPLRSDRAVAMRHRVPQTAAASGVDGAHAFGRLALVLGRARDGGRLLIDCRQRKRDVAGPILVVGPDFGLGCCEVAAVAVAGVARTRAVVRVVRGLAVRLRTGLNPTPESEKRIAADFFVRRGRGGDGGQREANTPTIGDSGERARMRDRIGRLKLALRQEKVAVGLHPACDERLFAVEVVLVAPEGVSLLNLKPGQRRGTHSDDIEGEREELE